MRITNEQLSEHFLLSEFTYSKTAKQNDIDNTPNAKQIDAMRQLCLHVLERARDIIGFPMTVSSGFRCNELNILVGGSATSQHKTGQAADIVFNRDKARGAVFFNAVKNNCDFDQLIWEFGNTCYPNWVHVSYVSPEKNRREVLKSVRRGGKITYIKLK